MASEEFWIEHLRAFHAHNAAKMREQEMSHYVPTPPRVLTDEEVRAKAELERWMVLLNRLRR